MRVPSRVCPSEAGVPLLRGLESERRQPGRLRTGQHHHQDVRALGLPAVLWQALALTLTRAVRSLLGGRPRRWLRENFRRRQVTPGRLQT